MARMIFVRRQAAAIKKTHISYREFWLASRTSPFLLISELKRFRRELFKFCPDLIHAQFGSVTAAFCALASQKPLVVTFRGSDLNPCSGVPWVRSAAGRLMSQFAALRARQIICVSHRLREKLWWKRDCVTVVPSGVDRTVFYPRPKEQARADLGWRNEDRVVLFNTGENSHVKRLDLALLALEFAGKICGKIKLVTLDGDVDPDLIPAYMNASDCLLLTSDYEGSPNIVKEAIACDLPVVAVNVGDVCERLNRVQPSRVVSRNPVEIGKALAEILISEKRSNGHQISEELSLDKLATRILEVYHRALH
jgi:glycosyltransferase involved in cell wall biosynthesis